MKKKAWIEITQEDHNGSETTWLRVSGTSPVDGNPHEELTEVFGIREAVDVAFQRGLALGGLGYKHISDEDDESEE